MDIKDRILYEDNHLIIVNKEVGELSQGDQSGDPTLVDDQGYLKKPTTSRATSTSGWSTASTDPRAGPSSTPRPRRRSRASMSSSVPMR